MKHIGGRFVSEKTVLERFIEKYIVDPITGCWLWTARINTNGYGHFFHNGTMRDAHRVSYELHVGTVPDGLELDHKCRVRRCVNWDHLEPVTHKVNVHRGVGACANNARKTHCPKGHPYDELNSEVQTYISKRHGKVVARVCITCKDKDDKERYQRQKEMRCAQVRARYWEKKRAIG